jgi:hypothetical protein
MFDITLLVQQALAHADHALRDMGDRRCLNIAPGWISAARTRWIRTAAIAAATK